MPAHASSHLLPAFTRSLPGGVTVTLLQVSTPERATGGEKPKIVYWQPDGTRSETSLTNDPRIVGILAKMPGLELLAEHDVTFSFLFIGLADGQTPSITRLGGQGFDDSSWITLNGKGLKTGSCAEPKGRREESFRIGIPPVKWTTEKRVGINDIHTGSNQMDRDMKSLEKGRLGARFIGIYHTVDPNSAPSISVLFGTSANSDTRGVERKVTLLDGKGDPLESNVVLSATGKNYLLKMISCGPKTAQHAAFVLVETGKTAYATIDHVALKPKGPF